ncbi:glycoside hydrolase domain-containing protein [Micromonospora sp. NPDC049060]|uniref:glycoside hydrolase domain-containing protein n=1 Tax=Micromonospora sp. NPDC049060 TaxID=3154828 RepID=UPI0033F7D963
MSDPKVLEAQEWVNSTYQSVPYYNPCPENGKTGWATMYSLTRALQHELGIEVLSDAFGPGTMSRLATLGDIGPDTTNGNIVNIVQYALFCKGYWGGPGDGVYGVDTASAIAQLKADAGLDASNTDVQPKVFKSLLTMDAYILVSGGRAEVRNIQRWLNGRYLSKSTFYIVPCDGHYTRDVQQALMKAIQYEIGIPQDQANGNFGPGTQQGLRNNEVAQGSSGIFVQIFSAACVFNGTVRDDGDSYTTVFKSTFDAALATYVAAFQRFSVLDDHGRGDYRTWAQLLVSTGDADRPAHACDTRYHISESRARALVTAGYHTVGRYLDEDEPKEMQKEIQPGELNAIFAGGMRMFPISQYRGRYLSDFTYSQGYSHAVRAHDRALGYGFNRGTIIYFAVDYDATDEEITSNIIPYFRGVQAGLSGRGKRYLAGVYGSRNVCSRATSEAYARFSFVSGMSWGFSGNLGFPMPDNWSFTQIKEFRFTAGADSFDLDRNVHRPGTDPGVGPENIGGTGTPLAAFLTYIDQLYATAVSYGHGADPNRLVLDFLRYPQYDGERSGWNTLLDTTGVSREWIAYAVANGPARRPTFIDPAYGVQVNVDHLAATACAVYAKGSGGTTPGGSGWRGDFGGWGGDLTTFYADWWNNEDSYASGYAFCMDRLAKINVDSSFSFGDLIEDADGYLVGMALRGGAKVHEAIRGHLGGTGHLSRFRNFFTRRYGSTAGATSAARTLLCGTNDLITDGLRVIAIELKTHGALLPHLLPDSKLNPFIQGYVDTLQNLVGQEARISRRTVLGR